MGSEGDGPSHEPPCITPPVHQENVMTSEHTLVSDTSNETTSSPLTKPAVLDLERVGGHVVRYGLAVVVLWIGLMKFTLYEAEAIKGFVANSPLLGWMYRFFGTRAVSSLFGAAEILIAVLIAARPLSARASALGSALAVGMFLTTLTFLFSTPGIGEASAGGFPAISIVGQFVLKDMVLLGAALWTLGEALRHRATAGA